MNVVGFLEVAGILFILICMMFLAYVTTKFIGKKAANRLQGRHIKVVETLSLGFDKRIILIKAGEKYLLLSSSSKRLEFLTEFLPEEIKDEEESQEQPFNFRNIFEKYLRLNRPEKEDKPSYNKNANAEKTKANLKRLRNLMENRIYKRKTGG